MALIIADSDVLIDHLRDREPVASLVDHAIIHHSLATTEITRFELLTAPSPSEREAVGQLLGPLRVLPLDHAGAEQAANVRRFLEARGMGIGTADYLIAGIVLANQGRLLTKNRRHFERVPGLVLEDI